MQARLSLGDRSRHSDDTTAETELPQEEVSFTVVPHDQELEYAGRDRVSGVRLLVRAKEGLVNAADAKDEILLLDRLVGVLV